MRDYYEELWERLPALEPSDFALRRAFLLERVNPGDAVLDLGCGEGHFSVALAEAGAHPIGMDVAAAAVRRASSRHPELTFGLVPFDGPLPLEDNRFDAVWAGEVIEHVADTARWLSEVRRVLKPGGRLLLTTPAHGRLRLLVFGVARFSEPLGEHLHLYTRASLEATLREFGFAELKVQSAGGVAFMRRVLLAYGVR